jgi:ATP-dependent Clp protease ATP-binding subunit ClpC
MFGNEDALIRIDMSEFMERHSVARLVGAPPGYIGYEEGGQLTEAVRRKSYCCILLDEIEKAHYDVFNMLLQIFDDGHLTDAKGRRVDFRNSIIIMTSNIGAELIKRETNIGFTTHVDNIENQQAAYEKMKEKIVNEMKKKFRPEFLNRLDATVVFHSLTKEHIRKIVDLMLSQVVNSLKEKEIALEVTDSAKDFLGEKGYDSSFGARPLRRTIQNMVENPLSEALLHGEFLPGDTVVVDIDDEKIVIRPLVKEALGT